MTVIVRDLTGPWQSVSAGEVTVNVHECGLVDMVRRTVDADQLPHLIDVLEHALTLTADINPEPAKEN